MDHNGLILDCNGLTMGYNGRSLIIMGQEQDAGFLKNENFRIKKTTENFSRRGWVDGILGGVDVAEEIKSKVRVRSSQCRLFKY